MSLDVSAAFHCIKILESQRQFQNIITFDFSKKNWQEHPLVIFNKSLSFGVKQSPPICEGVMRKVAQKASPYLKSIMLHSRVVDNIVWSQRSKHELLKREQELRNLMEQHCLPLKDMETNAENLGRKLPQQEATTHLLGLTWNENTDKIGPNWHLNLTKKIKGIPSGDNLTP